MDEMSCLVVPRVTHSLGTIFSLSAAHFRKIIIPWENITLLAVQQKVIFHDRPGQYLNNIVRDLLV